MLYELVANDHHNNGTALYKCYDGDNLSYKKVAIEEKANGILENEKTGYDWFFEISGYKGPQVSLSKGRFYELDMPAFEGKGFPEWSRLSGNEEYVNMVTDSYCRYWNRSEEFRIHGDLALCNAIILKNGDIMVVDWEHSHVSDRSNFGVDIINLLMTAMSYELFNGRFLLKRLKGIIVKTIDKLRAGAPRPNRVLDRPFMGAYDYMRQRFKGCNKFPILKCDSNRLKELDIMVFKKR